MIRVTSAHGFHMTFENGWTVSVQFGSINYCNNKFHTPGAGGCTNAEVAFWNDAIGGSMLEPEGWQTPDQVLVIMQKVAAMPRQEAA